MNDRWNWDLTRPDDGREWPNRGIRGTNPSATNDAGSPVGFETYTDMRLHSYGGNENWPLSDWVPAKGGRRGRASGASGGGGGST